jgi:hypothetical protein
MMKRQSPRKGLANAAATGLAIVSFHAGPQGRSPPCCNFAKKPMLTKMGKLIIAAISAVLWAVVIAMLRSGSLWACANLR